ncbi:hypothetical protein, partial [Paracoccus sp. (in: a-proteobacteria)]|uniref:hypothetical protein n=1 Tax=Paracoccus sp. TaxID=267 RepID=UPI003A844830
QHIGPAPRIPVMRAGAALSSRRIAMGALHIGGKSAFVLIYDGASITLISRNLFAEGMPRGFVRLRVRQGFFYM